MCVSEWGRERKRERERERGQQRCLLGWARWFILVQLARSVFFSSSQNKFGLSHSLRFLQNPFFESFAAINKNIEMFGSEFLNRQQKKVRNPKPTETSRNVEEKSSVIETESSRWSHIWKEKLLPLSNFIRILLNLVTNEPNVNTCLNFNYAQTFLTISLASFSIWQVWGVCWTVSLLSLVLKTWVRIPDSKSLRTLNPRH